MSVREWLGGRLGQSWERHLRAAPTKGHAKPHLGAVAAIVLCLLVELAACGVCGDEGTIEVRLLAALGDLACNCAVVDQLREGIEGERAVPAAGDRGVVVEEAEELGPILPQDLYSRNIGLSIMCMSRERCSKKRGPLMEPARAAPELNRMSGKPRAVGFGPA